MTSDPLLLLAGPAAVALAPRLTASGYTTVDWLSAGVASSRAQAGQEPVAAILAADQRPLISDLRLRFGGMPILLDLEQDTVEARSACLCSGADDFWLSSVGPSDLLMRLRLHRTIQSRDQQRPSLLKVEDLSVDISLKQVRRGGRPLALTAREYALLLALLQHPGRAFSREELLAQVWQDERATSSNVVEVYIRYLRQKLEEQGEPRLVHTVRGRGYRVGPSADGT
jgi:DNA-binding response OmpR family regulator